MDKFDSYVEEILKGQPIREDNWEAFVVWTQNSQIPLNEGAWDLFKKWTEQSKGKDTTGYKGWSLTKLNASNVYTLQPQGRSESAIKSFEIHADKVVASIESSDPEAAKELTSIKETLITYRRNESAPTLQDIIRNISGAREGLTKAEELEIESEKIYDADVKGSFVKTGALTSPLITSNARKYLDSKKGTTHTWNDLMNEYTGLVPTHPAPPAISYDTVIRHYKAKGDRLFYDDVRDVVPGRLLTTYKSTLVRKSGLSAGDVDAVIDNYVLARSVPGHHGGATRDIEKLDDITANVSPSMPNEGILAPFIVDFYIEKAYEDDKASGYKGLQHAGGISAASRQNIITQSPKWDDIKKGTVPPPSTSTPATGMTEADYKSIETFYHKLAEKQRLLIAKPVSYKEHERYHNLIKKYFSDYVYYLTPETYKAMKEGTSFRTTKGLARGIGKGALAAAKGAWNVAKGAGSLGKTIGRKALDIADKSSPTISFR